MVKLSLLGVAVFLCTLVPACAQGLKESDVRYEGMQLTVVPYGKTFPIEPLAVFHDEYEAVLPAGQPNFRGPLLLRKCAWVSGSLAPGSLVITPEGKPEVKLKEGTDYRIDPLLAAVGGVEGSPYANTRCRFEYDYTYSRLDLIERKADGTLALKKGTEDRSQPSLPPTSEGATALIGIYLAPNTTSLSAENVNLIDPNFEHVPPVANAGRLATVKEKMAAGKPVAIVFFGDSITAQPPSDFRDGKGSFVDRFAKYLEGKQGRKVVVTPAASPVEPADGQIVIVKAGVGGDDTRRARARMEKDVVSHRPDLVVVMFGVNDENRRGNGNAVPVDEYRQNLLEIVSRVREAGGDVVLMTTSMKNLKWSSSTGRLAEYAAAAREVAKETNCCLVDNYRAWELIPKTGYHYMVFLGTCLNHPVDKGHELFFRGLKEAFERNE